MAVLPFPLASSPAPFKFQGEARLRNIYPERVDQAKSPVAFLSIPGQSLFAEVAGTSSRGAIFVEELDCFFSLHGSALKKITRDGAGDPVVDALEGIVAGSKPAIMERGAIRFMRSEVTISLGNPGTINWINHRLPAGTPLQFATDGELPASIEGETTYYVAEAGLTANTFRLALTEGGGAIEIAGDQSGTHTATRTSGTYQTMIASDASVYCVEDGNVFFVEMPEEGINSVTWLKSRFILGFDSGRYAWSELGDGRTIDPLAFANAEARPDGLVRVFAQGGVLYLFGKTTTEVHTDTSDPDAPFAPLGGAFINFGCASKMSVVDFDNAPHWLGHDDKVYRAVSYQEAQRVSDHGLERAIKAVKDKTTIRGYVDSDEGHLFYVLTCPQWTWALDASTRKWHERNSYQRANWRAWPYVGAWGKRLVGDAGDFYELGATHDEAGRPIRRELILPDVPGRMFHHWIEIQCATGVGLNVAPGADGYNPLLMLSWSDDGGHTWSSERLLELGPQGQYGRLVRATGLGRSDHNGRRYKIACSEPTIVSFTLTDLNAEPWA